METGYSHWSGEAAGVLIRRVILQLQALRKGLLVATTDVRQAAPLTDKRVSKVVAMVGLPCFHAPTMAHTLLC